jgi:amino acid adenylation domain-containing protein
MRGSGAEGIVGDSGVEAPQRSVDIERGPNGHAPDEPGKPLEARATDRGDHNGAAFGGCPDVSDAAVILEPAPPVRRPASLRARLSALEQPRTFNCLHEIFEHQVGRDPTRRALECGERVWSYGAVEKEANRLARYLRGLGVGPGKFVGIALARSEWPMVAIIAVLKAGAAYVPIEPSLPDERLRYIAETANLAAVVTQTANASRLSKICSVAQVVIEDYRQRAPALSHERLSCEQVGVKPADPCYVLFTSGTTGRPKGVVTEHRNVVHFVDAFNDVCCTTEADRVFQGFALGFDGSVEEMWMAFSNGATLVCGDRTTPRFGAELAAFLKDREITFLSTVPTLLSTLPRDVPSLRQLVVSGEPCPADLANRWSQRVVRMLNVYGPTEATVNTTAAVLKHGRPVTIGRPLHGYETHILDEKLQPVRPGQKGELFIGGPTLARGYMNEPALTAQSFVEWTRPSAVTPKCRGKAVRLYKTGDLVRQREDGALEFFGRIDHQVKVRGHRIELAEIEAVLLEHAEIAAAVVRVYEHAGVQGLAAYVSLAPGATAVDRAEILRKLRGKLPAYMVPTHLDVLQQFPTLASGKVDRGKLPEPEHALIVENDLACVEMTDLETLIAGVWAKLFRLPKVGPDQDFFSDLGGHSLLAAQLVNALRSDLGLNVAIRDIYADPTVRRLARAIDRSESQEAAGALRDRQSGGGMASVRYRERRGLTNLVQVLYLLSVVPLLALPLLYIIPLAIDALNFRASVLTLAATGLGIALATWATLIVVTILAKWIIVGRYRPGRYPLWGSYYLRWWVVSRLQHLSRLSAFDGTPLAPVIWRALGAKVGARCVLNAGLVYAWDCIRVGDDVSIGADTTSPAQDRNGDLVIGKIELWKSVLHWLPFSPGPQCHNGRRQPPRRSIDAARWQQHSRRRLISRLSRPCRKSGRARGPPG